VPDQRQGIWKRTWQLFAVALAAALIACSTTKATVRDDNRESLLDLRTGMSREEVLAVMGTGKVRTYPSPWVLLTPFIIFYPLHIDSVTNPYRNETTKAVEGVPAEIVYYYTDVRSGGPAATDPEISEDELTPLVFEDGNLVGWGWSFLHQNVQRYEVELRVR